MTVSVVAGQPSVQVSEQSITWAPIAEATPLSFLGTSYDEVQAALRLAFGNYPIRLSGGNHMMVLQGMIAATGTSSHPYRTLYEALSKFGAVEIDCK